MGFVLGCLPLAVGSTLQLLRSAHNSTQINVGLAVQLHCHPRAAEIYPNVGVTSNQIPGTAFGCYNT